MYYWHCTPDSPVTWVSDILVDCQILGDKSLCIPYQNGIIQIVYNDLLHPSLPVSPDASTTECVLSSSTSRTKLQHLCNAVLIDDSIPEILSKYLDHTNRGAKSSRAIRTSCFSWFQCWEAHKNCQEASNYRYFESEDVLTDKVSKNSTQSVTKKIDSTYAYQLTSYRLSTFVVYPTLELATIQISIWHQ